MPDVSELLKTIKQAAIDAVEASKPVNIRFGTVTNNSPLQIQVEQKMLLGQAQLVLTRNVTEYHTEITVESKKVSAIVHNGLSVGEKVILLREQGGQKYTVLDRIE